MQSRELEVGKDFLYQSYMRRHATAYDYMGREDATKARVVSTPAHGMVEVVLTYDGEKKPSGVKTVNVRNLICTWAEHQQALAEKQARRAARVDEMEANAVTVRRLTGLKRSELPHGLDGYVSADGSFSDRGKISLAQLAAMLEVAYALGQQSAKGGA